MPIIPDIRLSVNSCRFLWDRRLSMFAILLDSATAFPYQVIGKSFGKVLAFFRIYSIIAGMALVSVYINIIAILEVIP